MIKNKLSKKLCYIGGPMGGIEEFNHPEFYAAEPAVIKLGFTPVNPARNFDGDTTLPYEMYMHKSIKQILDCQAIYMLKGWEHSRGANIEHDIACALGLEIHYQAGMPSSIPLEVPNEESVLQVAERLVNGDRQNSYGHPYHDYLRTVSIFRALTGHDLSVQDGIKFMICVKLSREAHHPKLDNRIDLCGYVECLDKVIKEEKLLDDLSQSKLAPF